MGNFIKHLPAEPSFKQRGLSGYTYPLANKHVEVDLIDSHAGHDYYVVSSELTHIYYVIQGSGTFFAASERFEVAAEQLIELPPGTEFSYSGRMKLLLVLTPPFEPGAVAELRPNPDVFGEA